MKKTCKNCGSLLKAVDRYGSIMGLICGATPEWEATLLLETCDKWEMPIGESMEDDKTCENCLYRADTPIDGRVLCELMSEWVPGNYSSLCDSWEDE